MTATYYHIHPNGKKEEIVSLPTGHRLSIWWDRTIRDYEEDGFFCKVDGDQELSFHRGSNEPSVLIVLA